MPIATLPWTGVVHAGASRPSWREYTVTVVVVGTTTHLASHSHLWEPRNVQWDLYVPGSTKELRRTSSLVREKSSQKRKVVCQREAWVVPAPSGFSATVPMGATYPLCGSDGKESVCNAEGLGLIPGWGRSPGGSWQLTWRRKWQLTPVFLPRDSRGQRSLVGYSP